MTETTPTSPTHADRGPRDTWLLALQVLRLPAALASLGLVAQLRPDIAQSMGLYASGGVSSATAWYRMVVAAFTFMLIVTVGRQRRPPGLLLAVEAAVAAVLGFTPRFLWGSWLNHHSISRAIGFEFVAPLAIAWFVVCVAALVRRWRRSEPHDVSVAGIGPRVGRLSARVGAWLPWLRIPALVGLLLLAASHRRQLTGAASEAAFMSAWVPLVLTTLAFMVIAVAGRHRRAPWPPLAVELVLAGMLGFTERFQWLTWMGASGLASALVTEFTAPLAIAWFTFVLVAAFERVNATRTVRRRSFGGVGQGESRRP